MEFYVLIDKRKPTAGVGCVEFIEMSEQQDQVIAKAKKQINELLKSSEKSPSDDERLVFLAKTPDSQMFKIFSDGTWEGFPDGTRVYNYWVAVLNYKIVSRAKRIKERFDTNNQENGVIPAGTQIRLYEAPFILQQDVKVDASQEFINKVLKDQQDWFKQPKSSETSSMVAIDLPASGEWQLISSTSFDPLESLDSRFQFELEEPQSDT